MAMRRSCAEANNASARASHSSKVAVGGGGSAAPPTLAYTDDEGEAVVLHSDAGLAAAVQEMRARQRDRLALHVARQRRGSAGRRDRRASDDERRRRER